MIFNLAYEFLSSREILEYLWRLRHFSLLHFFIFVRCLLLLLLVHCFNLILDGSLYKLQVLFNLGSVLNVLASALPR